MTRTHVDSRILGAIWTLSLVVCFSGCGGGGGTATGTGGASDAGTGGAGGASTGGTGGAGGASTGGTGGAGGATSGGTCISNVVGTCLVSIDGTGTTSSCVEFSVDGSAICAASNGIGTMTTTYVAGATRCPTANLEGCCNSDLTSIGSVDTETCYYPSHPNHGKQQQSCVAAVNTYNSWCPTP